MPEQPWYRGLGKRIWSTFDVHSPSTNFAGHALVSLFFAYVNAVIVGAFMATPAVGVLAGAVVGMNIYAYNELRDILDEMRTDGQRIKWMDHFKDFVAAGPGTALGALLAHLTFLL